MRGALIAACGLRLAMTSECFRDVAPIVRVPESSAALGSEDKDESAGHGR